MFSELALGVAVSGEGWIVPVGVESKSLTKVDDGETGAGWGVEIENELQPDVRKSMLNSIVR